MRSSNKSRSRSKSPNRNRNGNSMGNVVNRVFDSAGPEGRVRGTPQQIIEKYRMLAHDATLADDRVGAESFHQHAEHYARLLVTAQNEAAERQAEQQRRQQNAPRPQHNDGDAQPETGGFVPRNNSDVVEPNSSDIVETPENKPKVEKPQADKPRAKRAPKPKPVIVETVEPDAQ